LQANLGEAAGIREFVDKLRESRVEPDILINNAGSLVKRAKLLEFTDELFDQVMNLNVKSAWLITQAVVPSMAQRGDGVIVISARSRRETETARARPFMRQPRLRSPPSPRDSPRSWPQGDSSQRRLAWHRGQRFPCAVFDVRFWIRSCR
jgi:NAD(P)-dependent dehydrogenase (short-subunit alcohol dehydrogenase family)